MTVSRLMLRLLPLGLMALVLGCGSQNSESVSSEGSKTSSPPGQSAPSTSTTLTEKTGSAHGLLWDVPEGFVKDTPAGTMRAAQYKIPATQEGMRDAELALFFFGAGVGGETQANLERWANQFQQADGSNPMEKAKVETFKAKSGLSVTTIEVTGRYQTSGMGSGPSYDMPGWALFGAVVEGEGGPWFFKAVGPEAVMSAQREHLLQLYRSVRLGS